MSISIPPHRFFPYLKWTDVAAMKNQGDVVIIQPIGAIEQHGPHLPLIVDGAIATAVLAYALNQLPVEIPAYALPTLYYGKSNEHLHFPGTISLSSHTLMMLLMEIGESLYRSGFRKWILMNAHGGQPQIMELVARDLHIAHSDFLIFPLFVWRVPNLSHELLTEKEQELGIHAGDGETSLMLSILPDHVSMEKAIAEYPQDLPTNSCLTMEGQLPFAWATRDLSRSGTLGDPTTATRDKGDRILESLGRGWMQVIHDVHQFRQPNA